MCKFVFMAHSLHFYRVNEPVMIKGYCFALFLLLIATYTPAQTTAAPPAPRDTIFKLNGAAMPVDITTVTPTYISFILPGKKEEFTIERKEVQRIVYKTGKIDVLNKAAFELIDDSSWEAVWMTEDKKEVGDLYMLGEIEAKSPSSARSASAAKKGAIIKLKKKAANMKGTLILVTKKETSGGYGEYPGYYIKGIAYGTEPPVETAPAENTPAQTKGTTVKDAGM
jgi:hypothetical protein